MTGKTMHVHFEMFSRAVTIDYSGNWVIGWSFWHLIEFSDNIFCGNTNGPKWTAFKMT